MLARVYIKQETTVQVVPARDEYEEGVGDFVEVGSRNEELRRFHSPSLPPFRAAVLLLASEEGVPVPRRRRRRKGGGSCWRRSSPRPAENHRGGKRRAGEERGPKREKWGGGQNSSRMKSWRREDKGGQKEGKYPRIEDWRRKDRKGKGIHILHPQEFIIFLWRFSQLCSIR